jgi:hypothetical protein
MEAVMAAHFLHHQPVAHGNEEPVCSIWYIQQRLGRRDYKIGRLVAYVEKLIDCWNFPKPFPRLKGKSLVCDVSDRSQWPREAVDQWLFDYLPPDTHAALDAAAFATAAKQMDARAGNLRLVKGGRV